MDFEIRASGHLFGNSEIGRQYMAAKVTTKTNKTATQKKTTRKAAPSTSPRKKPVPKRIAVVVLGMHRSGTSALAGVLHLLGCDAPAKQMKPSKDNEKGYFEAESVYGLHTELLNSAGSSWDDWLPMNPGWFKSGRVEEFHDRALDLVKQEFGTSRLFVLKDPRICRLVPFWEDVLKESDAAPRYVMTHRNPLEVAASLAQRDGMDTGTGMLIWLRHVLDGEAATRGKTRCFVNFASLLGNWAGAMTRIQDALDLSFPRFSVGVTSEVEAFLDKKLRHHDEAPTSTLDNPLLSEWVRDTYAILEKWAASGEAKTDYKKLDVIRAALTSAGTTFAPVIQDSRRTAAALTDREAKLSTLQEEHEKLDNRLNDAVTARDNLAENRDTIRAERDALKTDLSQVQEERDSVRDALTKSMSEKASLEGSLTSIESERNKLKENLTKEVQALKSERAAFEKQASELTTERDSLLNKRESLVFENATLRESRNEVAEARDALRAQLADAKSRLENAEEANSSLERENKVLDQERDSFRAAHDQIRQEKDKLEHKIARLQTSFDQSVQEQDRLSSQLATLSSAHDRLAQKRESLEGLKKEAERARDEVVQTLTETRSRLDTLSAEREADQATLNTLQDELSQAQSALAQRSHEAEQTHRELQAIKAEQSDRDRRFVEMKTSLTRKETALEQETNRIGQLKRDLSDKTNQIAILETSAKTQQREITQLTKILRDSEQAAQTEISELTSRGAYAEAAYESIRASTSWRITAPLRWFVQKLRS